MNIKEKQQFQQILDWLEQRLTPEETQAVAASMPNNLTAQETAEWLQTFLDLSQQLVLVRPPATVRSALRHRFDQQHRRRQSPAGWQRLTARLAFDSSRQLAVAGMRSAVLDDMVQQLVYATPTVEVALHLQPRSDDSFDLYGQVFPLDATADTIYAVQLCQIDSEKAITATDDLGEFSFQAINTGTYDIILSSNQLEVVITPVTFDVKQPLIL
jgi:hypothetical protein